MTPLPFVWPYALLFWAVLIWAYVPEFRIVRSARRNQGAADSRSLQLILRGQSLASLVSYPLAWIPALQFSILHRAAVFFIGIATIFAGSLLRRHCWRMLGGSFTGDVQATPDQAIVTRGAYRFVRHPSYTAGIMLNAGVGIALGSWASTVLLGATSVAVYRYRMTVEERALAAVVGEPYREFMRRRKRLIPFVY